MPVLRILSFLCVLPVVSGACAPDAEEVTKMSSIDTYWLAQQVQNFEVDITNAKDPKHVIFIVKHNDQYPYSNLFLISSIRDQDGREERIDTLNYSLAKPNGEWIGSGFGAKKEMWLEYKRDFFFPKEGKYLFRVRHGMRRDSLPGIEGIGLKINSVNPKQGHEG